MQYFVLRDLKPNMRFGL